MSRWPFWRKKKFFGKIPLYYNIFEFQYFRASSEQQSAVLANLLSKRPSEHFEEKDVFWKKYTSLMLSELELKDSDRKFETAFYISTGTFRGKFCLVGKFNFFLSFPRCRQKIFGTFTNPIGGVVQLAFFDSTGTCWGKCSLVEKKFTSFHQFWTLSKKKHGKCVKKVFWVSIATFWRKISFSANQDFFITVSRLECKAVRQVVKPPS